MTILVRYCHQLVHKAANILRVKWNTNREKWEREYWQIYHQIFSPWFSSILKNRYRNMRRTSN